MRKRMSVMVPVIVIAIAALGFNELAASTGATKQSPSFMWLLVSLMALATLATTDQRNGS